MWMTAALVLSVAGCGNDEDFSDGPPEERELRGDLEDSIAWLQSSNVRSNSTYTIVLSKDESIRSVSLSHMLNKHGSAPMELTLILRGEGALRTITLQNGAFDFGPYAKRVILKENIAIKGAADSNGQYVVNSHSDMEMNDTVRLFGGSSGGVYIGGGTFTMNGGRIYGNTGKGVVTGGAFTMNGGEIYGNGGGVEAHIFTMNGGKIRDNTSAGGVLVGSTFTMSGGEIFANTNNSEYNYNNYNNYNNYTPPYDVNGGGGVCVKDGGTFTITGGAIYNNKVEKNSAVGGGVYLGKSGTFTMSGGTIYGNKALSSSSFYSYSYSYGSAYGGGVFIAGELGWTESGEYGYNGGTFDMSAGEIYGNTVKGTNAYGGGVAFQFGQKDASHENKVFTGGVFKKTGGILYGYDAADNEERKAKNNKVTDDEDAVQTGKGHAAALIIMEQDARVLELKTRADDALAGDSLRPSTAGDWDATE